MDEPTEITLNKGAPLFYLDPYCGGHHGEYLRFFLDFCAREGIAITAFTPQKSWDDAKALLPTLPAGVSHVTEDFSALSLIESARRLGELDKLACSMNGVVFIGMLDVVLSPMLISRALGARAPLVGIYFRDSFSFFRGASWLTLGGVKALVKWAALIALCASHTTTLLTLDPYWTRWLPSPVIWLPDALTSLDEVLPADTSSNVEANECRFRILLFGALEERKGVVELLRALLLLTDAEIARLSVVICGRFSSKAYRSKCAAVAREALNRGGTIRITDEFISNEDLRSEIEEAGAIWACYRDHVGSSGVVGLAARYSRPLIAQDSFQIGREVRDYRLGVTANWKSTSSIVSAIRSLMRRDFAFDPATLTSYLKERDRSQSYKVLKKVICGAPVPISHS